MSQSLRPQPASRTAHLTQVLIPWSDLVPLLRLASILLVMLFLVFIYMVAKVNTFESTRSTGASALSGQRAERINEQLKTEQELQVDVGTLEDQAKAMGFEPARRVKVGGEGAQ